MSLELKQRHIRAAIQEITHSPNIHSRRKGIACAYLEKMLENSDFYRCVAGPYLDSDDPCIGYLFVWSLVQTGIPNFWQDHLYKL